ncbi:MAG: type II toxin-antitoxin system VapC family toxin [Phycisphaerales bacterium]|nr:type II toxin-antitoxin system VapC family toxin [Phycisphaerales bacterium]
MLNLDTHILVFALSGNLTSTERKILSAEKWGGSDIVFWEIAMLIQRGRIALDLTDPAVARVLAELQVWPITLDIASAIHDLDFDSDPADELIAATSLRHNIPLVTRDSTIRHSKVVPLAF